MRSFAAHGARAVIMECMAINPDYQDWLENKVMHSQITIITNVRIDHQEEMGDTLLDIARSLARSIPRKAILITAETKPEVVAIFKEVCEKKGTKLFLADPKRVKPRDLALFSHVAHADNVTIGLTVAELFGIPHDRAIRAMAGALPDPGAFHLESFTLFGKEVVWANLFAVNDKESFAQLATVLARNYPRHYRIVMLNNRHDRPSRVEMFCELAQNEYRADAIVALGDYEERVHAAITRKDVTVALLGNNSRFATSSGEKLLRIILGLAKSDRQKILLVGTVNIHTTQSQRILPVISKVAGEKTPQAAPAYSVRVPRQTIKAASPAEPVQLVSQEPVVIHPTLASSEGTHVH
jgi:poly-gamma-glutamate synthase PgsB/CapB